MRGLDLGLLSPPFNTQPFRSHDFRRSHFLTLTVTIRHSQLFALPGLSISKLWLTVFISNLTNIFSGVHSFNKHLVRPVIYLYRSEYEYCCTISHNT